MSFSANASGRSPGDLTWLTQARELAFRHLPWRDELEGEIRVFLMLQGGHAALAR
ncbi:MAG: hypothetical protein AB1816_17145 [Bacillota bacterium]